MHSGACLCGAISYQVNGPMAAPVACHCIECRKQSGHVWAVASTPRDTVTISGSVSWYAASTHGERGFYPRCGSFLFWRGMEGEMIEIGLGALESPTSVSLPGLILVADKGDYYDITDGLPHYEGEVP